MRGIAALAGLALATTVGGCGALVVLTGSTGAVASEVCGAPGAPSTTAPTVSTGTGAVPARIGDWSGEQVADAALVVAAGQRQGVGLRGQTIAVMTAMGESSLENVDRGDAAGPDSRGLFQQRGNGAWGSYAERMDPTTAATSFYRALVRVAGWESMAPTLAAHAVQGNADPWHYERFWSSAVEVVAALTGTPALAERLPVSAALPCSPTDGSTVTGPGGAFAPEGCTVRPDPTTGRGCLTPRTAALAAQLVAQGRHLSCWDAHAWNPTSDHPTGRACDVFPGRGGVLPSATEKAEGDALAASLETTADRTGVAYLIWYGRIWSTARADEGWRPYSGGGVYDATSITGGHYDHVHVSMR